MEMPDQSILNMFEFPHFLNAFLKRVSKTLFIKKEKLSTNHKNNKNANHKFLIFIDLSIKNAKMLAYML